MASLTVANCQVPSRTIDVSYNKEESNSKLTTNDDYEEEETVDLSQQDPVVRKDARPHFFGRELNLADHDAINDTLSKANTTDKPHSTMTELGDQITHHAKNTVLKEIIKEAAKQKIEVSQFATRLISDAMHLRDIHSHRWTLFALKAHKFRNSHRYHQIFVTFIVFHFSVIVLEAPRGDWNSALHVFEEEHQLMICKVINVVSLGVYVLDILIQCAFQHVYWQDVDYSLTLNKRRRGSTTQTPVINDSIYSRRGIHTTIRETMKRVTGTHYNIVFILNFICVFYQVFDFFRVSQHSGWLRPLMLIWINYRLQTASGAMIRMLPALTDILVILVSFLAFFAIFSSLVMGPLQIEDSENQNDGFETFSYALLNFYVLLSTETFPNILDKFPAKYVFIPCVFTLFLALGYFILMAYLTAIVFDGYYDFKLKISLKEYFLERTAVATTFLAIAWNPDLEVYNDELTLSDLMDVKFKFNGKTASFAQLADLFAALDEDGNCGLCEDEFYMFCDALTSLFESDSNSNFAANKTKKADSGSLRSVPSFGELRENCSSKLSAFCANLFNRIPQTVSYILTLFQRLLQSNVLFFHILQIFRQGLIQIFFLLSFIWIYGYAVVGINMLGTPECRASAQAYKGSEVMYYESFATFSTAMLATFRLATGSGWHELLYMYWECGPSVPFFVSFHFTFCILFYNILGGLIFAQYKQLAISRKKQKQREPKNLGGESDKNKSGGNNKKRRESQDAKKKKKGNRNSRAVPEQRRSAKFWREELEHQNIISLDDTSVDDSEDGESGNSKRVSLFSSPKDHDQVNKGEHEVKSAKPKSGRQFAGKKSFKRLSINTTNEMWEDYAYKHVLSKRRGHEAKNHNCLGDHMAKLATQMLAPPEGMVWDVCLIGEKSKKENENEAREAKESEAARMSPFVTEVKELVGVKKGVGGDADTDTDTDTETEIENEIETETMAADDEKVPRKLSFFSSFAKKTHLTGLGGGRKDSRARAHTTGTKTGEIPLRQLSRTFGHEAHKRDSKEVPFKKGLSINDIQI